jgi:hypothetical protein
MIRTIPWGENCQAPHFLQFIDCIYFLANFSYRKEKRDKTVRGENCGKSSHVKKHSMLESDKALFGFLNEAIDFSYCFLFLGWL